MKPIFTTLQVLLFLVTTMNAQTTSKGQRDVFTFSYETQVEMTSSEDNKTYKMSYLLNPNESYIGMTVDMSAYSNAEVQGESIIIMDDGQSRIFVETQGMKMQMSQSMMGGNQMNNPTEELANYDYSKLNKTNETKTILGALCHKYVLADKDVTLEFWVAPEIKLPNWLINNNEIIDGHIMEYAMSSKDGQMTSTVVAINENISRTLNSKEYKKMF